MVLAGRLSQLLCRAGARRSQGNQPRCERAPTFFLRVHRVVAKSSANLPTGCSFPFCGSRTQFTKRAACAVQPIKTPEVFRKEPEGTLFSKRVPSDPQSVLECLTACGGEAAEEFRFPHSFPTFLTSAESAKMPPSSASSRQGRSPRQGVRGNDVPPETV